SCWTSAAVAVEHIGSIMASASRLAAANRADGRVRCGVVGSLVLADMPTSLPVEPEKHPGIGGDFLEISHTAHGGDASGTPGGPRRAGQARTRRRRRAAASRAPTRPCRGLNRYASANTTPSATTTVPPDAVSR